MTSMHNSSAVNSFIEDYGKMLAHIIYQDGIGFPTTYLFNS